MGLGHIAGLLLEGFRAMIAMTLLYGSDAMIAAVSELHFASWIDCDTVRIIQLRGCRSATVAGRSDGTQPASVEMVPAGADTIRGIDPNQYGRWVPNALHRKWHKGDPTEGLQPLSEFIRNKFSQWDAEQVLVTDDHIMALLAELRTVYKYPLP